MFTTKAAELFPDTISFKKDDMRLLYRSIVLIGINVCTDNNRTITTPLTDVTLVIEVIVGDDDTATGLNVGTKDDITVVTTFDGTAVAATDGADVAITTSEGDDDGAVVGVIDDGANDAGGKDGIDVSATGTGTGKATGERVMGGNEGGTAHSQMSGAVELWICWH